MDTIIFLLLAVTLYAMVRTGDRTRTLLWWAVSFVVVAAFLAYHVTDPLKLNF